MLSTPIAPPVLFRKPLRSHPGCRGSPCRRRGSTVALALDHDSLLRAELGHAARADSSPVRVDGRAVCRSADPGGAAEPWYRGFTSRHWWGRSYQREIVVGTGVRVRLAPRLHGQPRVVDERPGRLAPSISTAFRSAASRVAAVGVGLRTGAGAMGPCPGRRCSLCEEEVRSALRSVCEGLHSRRTVACPARAHAEAVVGETARSPLRARGCGPSPSSLSIGFLPTRGSPTEEAATSPACRVPREPGLKP